MTVMSKGSLEVIVGCMSSGKSEELIRRLKRATIAKQLVIVFKPGLDNRGEKLVIASRDGRLFDAIPIDNPREVFDHLKPEHKVVALDEAQFLPEDVMAVVQELIARGLRVLAAGLDTDFRGEPFGVVPELMAEADSVTKLTAVCVRCGQPAIRTQRLIAGQPAPYESPRIVVGGDELYEARCRSCHEVPQACLLIRPQQ
ncbi:MAG: thymidine kinase [Patescibacteria group bacterium]|nr:thymidine kinase [Patescibacteria group bacterium]